MHRITVDGEGALQHVELPDYPICLGRVIASPGAQRLARGGVNLATYLARHQSGDWGDLGADHQRRNDEALRRGERLQSVYRLDDGGTLTIVTEAGGSRTTLLLPEEA